MGQNKNKNFIAARLPQELYNRFDSVTGDEKGEKTRFIIKAIAAYLDFPLKTGNTTANNEEKFVALEDRIAELEQQFQKFKEFVINSNLTDNKTEIPVIASENDDNSSDDSIESDISIDNSTDNKKVPLVPIENDGRIGPAFESHIADFMGVKVSSLRYHRRTLKESGKPFNQPKRVEYNNKPYDLICQGESKIRGKTVILWIAKPVIEADNTIYQPDIIEYQLDNKLTDATQVSNQEEQKQDLESLEPSDNASYQPLSLESDNSQEQELEENRQDLETLDFLDNTSYQKLSEQSDIKQLEDNQNLQSLNSADNSDSQLLSAQSNSNEELNKQQQDSDKQSTEEHPEF